MHYEYKAGWHSGVLVRTVVPGSISVKLQRQLLSIVVKPGEVQAEAEVIQWIIDFKQQRRLSGVCK